MGLLSLKGESGPGFQGGINLRRLSRLSGEGWEGKGKGGGACEAICTIASHICAVRPESIYYQIQHTRKTGDDGGDGGDDNEGRVEFPSPLDSIEASKPRHWINLIITSKAALRIDVDGTNNCLQALSNGCLCYCIPSILRRVFETGHIRLIISKKMKYRMPFT